MREGREPQIFGLMMSCRGFPPFPLGRSYQTIVGVMCLSFICCGGSRTDVSVNSLDRWRLDAEASAHGLYKGGGLVGGSSHPFTTRHHFPLFLGLRRRVAFSLCSPPLGFPLPPLLPCFSLAFGGGFVV